MAAAAFTLSEQKPSDLVGTWFGSAYAEGDAESNDLTLVLEVKDGELAGHMTDSFSALVEAPIEEVTLENGKFNFSVSAVGPEGSALTVIFEMEVEEGSMKGKFDIPDMGIAGTWEATKK